MRRRIRVLNFLSAFAFFLGIILASPGMLLLLASSQLMGMAVDRELGRD